MGKKIVTRQEVEKWYFQGVKEISLDNDTIILPGAKDALMSAGIKVKPKDSREEQIKKAIEECCADSVDEALRDKIIKLAIAKYMAKTGGD